MGNSLDNRRKSGSEMENVEVRGTNGESVTISVNKFIGFVNIGEMKSEVAKKLNQDEKSFDLFGFDGEKETIFKFVFDRRKFCEFYFVNGLGEFKLGNYIGFDMFECVNKRNQKRHVAKRFWPFYSDGFRRSSWINEFKKWKQILHENVAAISDIRSDGKDLFVIFDESGGTRLVDYRDQIVSVTQMKYFCCQFICGLAELKKLQIKVPVEMRISVDDQRCFVVPYDFYFIPDSDLDKFYTEKFLDELGRGRHLSPLRYSSSEVDQFVTQLADHVESLQQSEDNDNILEDILN